MPALDEFVTDNIGQFKIGCLIVLIEININRENTAGHRPGLIRITSPVVREK